MFFFFLFLYFFFLSFIYIIQAGFRALESTREEDIFLKLKSSEPSVAYDGLRQIRSNITKTKEGYKTLRENKVLKDLVNLLHKPNEKILALTLSILGNCCLDSDCRTEVSMCC
jgi:hypothetical protein